MEESREELQKEYDEATVKAEQYQHEVQRLENRIRYYSEGERKKRNHRLICHPANKNSKRKRNKIAGEEEKRVPKRRDSR